MQALPEKLGQPSLPKGQKAMSIDQAAPPKPKAISRLGTGLTRQASLPTAPDSPARSALNALPKPKKQLLRMNSDSDLHIQPISSEEERVLETLDEIDLLHNIAKTPNILGSGSGGPPGGLKPPGSGSGAPPSTTDKRKLVKQKSLNRTLSTSVLRIKKKRCAFWNT